MFTLQAYQMSSWHACQIASYQSQWIVLVHGENENVYFCFVNAEFYRIVWTINALLTFRSEMLPFSENNQNIKMFAPPERFAIGYVHNDN